MSFAAPLRFTEAEYLALERASTSKHEFIAGEMVAMAGARPPHNVLCANVIALLVTMTRGRPCITFTSDQRLHVPPARLYAYPDAMVACGERRYTNDDPPSLLNPQVVIEVTSPSTEEYDRGTKFIHYQSILSLRDYVVVSHRERRIDHHRRLSSGQWLLTSHVGEGVVDLFEGDDAFSLGAVYANVDFDEGASE